MGCCASTQQNRATLEQSSSLKKHEFPCVSKSPPRPEEESVKEVLSEIPKLPKTIINEKELEVPQVLKKPTNLKGKIVIDPPGPVGSPPEEISDVSEMCSLSESISTTTLRETEEEDHHHHQWRRKEKDNNTYCEFPQRVYKSQGTKNGSYPGGAQSPIRRSDPSPQRHRNSSPARPANGPTRRDPGEISGRRSSTSPATRSNVSRSPSAARKTGPSPGRVRRMVQGPESGRMVQENGKVRGSEWQLGPKESLDNPLVSLECFIFL